MPGRKKSSSQIDAAVGASVNYEVTIADLAMRSQKRAWFVAGSAILMALLLALGYLLMLPLKERTPFLVLADPYTGTAAVAPLVSDLSNSPVTANAAINKANIANYVIARESYDYNILTQRDWGLVWTMSTKQEGEAYDHLLSPGNPASPIKLYGKTRAIRVNIISLTPNREGWFDKEGSATVRFQRVLVNKANGVPTVLDTRVATIIYTYNEALSLTDEQRFSNPLGFQVTDYRVVTELVSLPSQPPSAMAEQPVPGALPAPAAASGAGVLSAPGGVGQDASPAAAPGVVPQQPSSPQQNVAAPAGYANGANTR